MASIVATLQFRSNIDIKMETMVMSSESVIAMERKKIKPAIKNAENKPLSINSNGFRLARLSASILSFSFGLSGVMFLLFLW